MYSSSKNLWEQIIKELYARLGNKIINIDTYSLE